MLRPKVAAKLLLLPTLLLLSSACVQGRLSDSNPLRVGKAVATLKAVPPDRKVAILVENEGSAYYVDDSDLETIFASRMIDIGLKVITRTDLERVLKELDFQNKSGLTDKDAVQIGRMINVRLILIVSHAMGGCHGYQRIWARLLQIEQAEVIWANRGSIDPEACDYEWSELAEAVAATIPAPR